MVGVELLGCGRRKFPESSVELTLQASGLKKGILEGVEDGPIFLAHVKCDEVTSPVVPRTTTNRDGCGCGIPEWGEVLRAGPSCGSFSETEDLV
jgi:hypothetical protein